ncbi:DUF1120 domain-containing protein [Leclercia tamurae]|uniref:DUF1120 domain-containing protein n=1 Tax=Leclercia tamurae TaxID=2926467 RepID=A0ABT2R5I1_9ENTR|nr:DUF1120 domain-containing protein [Leclercia tamurae]MCU6676136.1 DUF1120 domain-containing protein [Leclercia tamurae]
MAHFKKTLSTLGVCAALVMAAQATAATEATLKVSGTIVPAACSTTLSNSGEVAYGSVASSVIRNAPEGNGLVQLGAKDITLTVTCDAASAMGFKMIDNRANTVVPLSASNYIVSPISGGNDAQSYHGFGLGLASNDAQIGAYSVVVDAANTKADSAAAGVVYSDDAGKNWRSGTAVYQVNDSARIVTVSNVGGSEPKLFREATFPLKISAGVQSSSVLGMDEITFDGNATLSLVYL